MSIKSVMPSNHLILCNPLLLLTSIFPSTRVFPKSWLFVSGSKSIGASASESVLSMNIQGWFVSSSQFTGRESLVVGCLPFVWVQVSSLRLIKIAHLLGKVTSCKVMEDTRMLPITVCPRSPPAQTSSNIHRCRRARKPESPAALGGGP